MDASSAQPRRRPAIELWRIAVLVIGAICFALLAIGRIPSRETHETILTTLRAIDVNHASLQRDILQARAGLLKNYDPLVASIAELHASVDSLRVAFPESGLENAVELDRELTVLEQSIDMDASLIERFKTDNAILQNSLTITTRILSELHASGDPRVQQALAGSAGLGNLMMQFEANPDERHAQSIREKLTAMLLSDAGDRPNVQSYVVHAGLILDTLPSVDQTIASILGARTSFEAQVLQKDYLDAFGTVSTRSAWSRILLGSISVLLCFYVAILVYRLQSQTHRLTQQLEIETLTANIKQRFAEDVEPISAAVSDSLSVLAEFFEASRHAFVVLNTESHSIVERFGNCDAPSLAPVVNSFSGQMSAAMMAEQLHWDRFFYQYIQSNAQSSQQGTPGAGAVVATDIDSGLAALLFLEFKDPKKKPSSDEIRLLGHAILALSQSLKTQRERKERKDLEARLEHAQRLESVGTLAGGIAHEFNNALSAIMGYGEMALQVNRTPSRTRQYVQEIISSGQRAKHIIDQILAFSRKRERVSRPFDVREAINEIIPLIKIALPDEVHISSEIAADMAAIVGNPIELQQVIMNLCTNAAQAISGNGRLDIKTGTALVSTKAALTHGELLPGRYVLISVTDNGRGIAPGLLPHIFEPFFTTRAAQGGTGLGLAAVHGNVAGMQGKIDVKSVPDEGTSFILYFPESKETPVPLAHFFDEKTAPLGEGEVVLLAQRNQNQRLMHEEKIAALGYEPLGFASVSALKKWLEQSSRLPDIILLDLDLWTSLPDVRQTTTEFSPIPVVFMVGQERVPADHRFFAGIKTLHKPVSSGKLAATLFELRETNRIDRTSGA